MNILLSVFKSPYVGDGHQKSLNFAREVVKSEHRLAAVFFYQDAVLVANGMQVCDPDERSDLQDWQQLSKDTGVALLCCSGASLHRGIVDPEHGKAFGVTEGNLAAGFELVNLSRYVQLQKSVDRAVVL